MHARKGFADSFRSRGRLIGCGTALALAVCAMGAPAASAYNPTKETYLALGDSLAFGYSQQLYNENEAAGDPAAAFAHGYPRAFFGKIHGHKDHSQLINLGCPGETTASLIGDGTLGVAMEGALGATTEAPCAYAEAWYSKGIDGEGGPLHFAYAGESQLEATLKRIITEGAADRPVTMITLDIGANDELHQVKKCEEAAEPEEEHAYGEAYEAALAKGETTEEAEAAGKAAAEEAGKRSVLLCISANVGPLFTRILTNINAVLYVLRNGEEFGYEDYTGQIVFQGGYNPYGNVYGTGEILYDSNLLVATLNEKEQSLVESYSGCFANPLPIFNPGGKKEENRLQHWTNMDNFTEFDGKKNGPDIHPTPVGYGKLAKIMVEACESEGPS